VQSRKRSTRGQDDARAPQRGSFEYYFGVLDALQEISIGDEGAHCRVCGGQLSTTLPNGALSAEWWKCPNGCTRPRAA